MREAELRDSNKIVDVIDEDGTVFHYRINDNNWYNHVDALYDYARELLKISDIPELKQIVESEISEEYIKLEQFLIRKLNQVIHKSWIEEDYLYHCFSLPKEGVTEEQTASYNILMEQFYEEEVLDVCDVFENIHSFGFAKPISKIK